MRLVGARAWADLRGAAACELVGSDERDARLARLGPDPLRRDADPARAWRRIHASRAPIATLLMDQAVVAGIGNMLKCEILYATRLWPGVKVANLLASQIDFLAGTTVGIVATAATFASKSQPFPYRVYDRAGLPCGICGNEIAVDRGGQDAHLTWYCKVCQTVGKEPTLFPA